MSINMDENDSCSIHINGRYLRVWTDNDSVYVDILHRGEYLCFASIENEYGLGELKARLFEPGQAREKAAVLL